MDIKEQITGRFSKTDFKIVECGSSAENDWNDLDEYIKDFLKKLNLCEHISTIYSCEGHKKDDQAYLLFSVNETGWNIFWNSVMPELSNKFCFIHPEVPDALYQMEWLVGSKANEHNAGIHISTTLENFAVKETGRVIVDWEKKKETFWDIIKETFLKYY